MSCSSAGVPLCARRQRCTRSLWEAAYLPRARRGKHRAARDRGCFDLQGERISTTSRPSRTSPRFEHGPLNRRGRAVLRRAGLSGIAEEMAGKYGQARAQEVLQAQLLPNPRDVSPTNVELFLAMRLDRLVDFLNDRGVVVEPGRDIQ